VFKRHFSARHGLQAYEARELVCEAGISGGLMLKLAAVITSLAEAFLAYDCTVLEINPLAQLGDNSLLPLDCHAEIEEAAGNHP
jgi:succinyl-CoA synthetase beta subunit